MHRFLSLLPLCGALLAADAAIEPLTVMPDGPVLLRLPTPPDLIPGRPAEIETTLESDGRTLAATTLELLPARQAAVRLALTPLPSPAAGVAWSATVAWRQVDPANGGLVVIRGRLTLPTLPEVGDRLRAARQRLLATHPAMTASDHPRAWLLLQQAEELASGRNAHDTGRSSVLLDLLERVIGPEGGAPRLLPGDLLAWRDPVDGSIQPLRLALPDVATTGMVVLTGVLPDPTSVSLARWRPPPRAWLEAADAAGVAVMVPYPAGDPHFTGMARRRLAGAIAAARTLLPELASVPCFVATADPEADNPAWWRRQSTPLATPPPLTGISAYADGPFVVVVGTGEHQAATIANRRLAEAFIEAWQRHAHGRPPLTTDREYLPTRFPGRRLLLVGSPRSNRIAAPYTWPLSWDHRTVRMGSTVLHRSDHLAIACRTDDQETGLPVVLIDGDPEVPGGMPLPWSEDVHLSQDGRSVPPP